MKKEKITTPTPFQDQFWLIFRLFSSYASLCIYFLNWVYIESKMVLVWWNFVEFGVKAVLLRIFPKLFSPTINVPTAIKLEKGGGVRGP